MKNKINANETIEILERILKKNYQDNKKELEKTKLGNDYKLLIQGKIDGFDIALHAIQTLKDTFNFK